MSVLQIMQDIKDERVEDEILQLLVADRVETLSEKSEALAEARATLRLIGKVTKDKTVQTILRED